MIRRNLRFTALVVTALLAGVGEASAQRAITVNGQLLTPMQIVIADNNVGFRLPSGHYWCDPQSGYWGQVGQNAWGRVDPSQCPSLPGASYLNRGQGGSTGSDGQCSYYNDPQSGASVMVGNCN